MQAIVAIIFPLFTIALSLTLIVLISFFYAKRSNINRRLFFIALAAKMIGSLFFSYTYQNLYDGGDTRHYHHDAKTIARYFWDDPETFFTVWLEGKTPARESNVYYVSQRKSFEIVEENSSMLHTVRLAVPFEIISFGNFYACSLWLAFLAFSGLWKLYEVLVGLFSKDAALLSIILFIPSILFWTGGILKDTYVFTAICWMIYALYQIIIHQKALLRYFLIIPLAFVLILMIKPYVLVVLIPSLMLWLSLELLGKIKERMAKILVRPILLFSAIILALAFMQGMQEPLGVYGQYDELIDYSFEVRKGYNLSVTQEQPKEMDQMETFSFGNLLHGVTSVIYRPYIWESWSSLSLMAALENFIILLFGLTAIIALLFYPKGLKSMLRRPFLLFCIIYSFCFAIGIGMSVSNFGAIVRLKTVFMVFYLIPFLYLISRLRRISTVYANRSLASS